MGVLTLVKLTSEHEIPHKLGLEEMSQYAPIAITTFKISTMCVTNPQSNIHFLVLTYDLLLARTWIRKPARFHNVGKLTSTNLTYLFGHQ